MTRGLWQRFKASLLQPFRCDLCGRVTALRDLYADPPLGPFWCGECVRTYAR